MNGRVDLHIHSCLSSDGDFPLSKIIKLARENGFKAISITDHDNVDAYPQALHLGEEAGVEVIPGIELTTLFQDREFHLLLPFVEWEREVVARLVKEAARRRHEEAGERIQKLQELGFDISWDEVIKVSGSYPPLGVTIAQTLLRKPESKKHPALRKYLGGKNSPVDPYNFYKDYFVEGKPASVPRKNLLLLDILKIVPETGGVAVLAHPGAYFQNVRKEDLVLLKERGLQGLEVYTTYHDSEETEFYKRIAEELNLVPTAGSDFHGTIKPHIPFGSIRNGGYWMVEELRKRRP